MANLLPYLLFLACPVGMALMMWLMMRGHQGQPMAGDQAAVPLPEGKAPTAAFPSGRLVPNGHVAATFRPTSTPGRTVRQGLSGLCLNWKVVGGLAAVGLGIWIVAPGLIWAALPLLLLAACPLSMLLMMRGMGMSGGQCAGQPQQTTEPAPVERTREEEFAELKTHLARLQAEQQTLARTIARLEAADADPLLTSAAMPAASDGHGTAAVPALHAAGERERP